MFVFSLFLLSLLLLAIPTLEAFRGSFCKAINFPSWAIAHITFMNQLPKQAYFWMDALLKTGFKNVEFLFSISVNTAWPFPQMIGLSGWFSIDTNEITYLWLFLLHWCSWLISHSWLVTTLLTNIDGPCQTSSSHPHSKSATGHIAYFPSTFFLIQSSEVWVMMISNLIELLRFHFEESLSSLQDLQSPKCSSCPQALALHPLLFSALSATLQPIRPLVFLWILTHFKGLWSPHH